MVSCRAIPRLGTEDAEIKSLSVENVELLKVLYLKPGVDQNIAFCVLPLLSDFFPVLVHETSRLCVRVCVCVCMCVFSCACVFVSVSVSVFYPTAPVIRLFMLEVT